MRLLLAEDEHSLSRAIITILERNGYQADAVYDGEEALNAIESGRYDGAILDIMMPKLDGLSVLRQTRARQNQIPILLLTARSEIDDKVEGLDLGANDYLTKPFASKELLARIRAMTRLQSLSLDAALSLGNISLNRTTFELSSSFGSFQLATKEFQVLELLMNSPGHPISTERFLEKIWGNEPAIDQDVVWMYISYLRKKLTALHADIQIRSIEGEGYLIELI
ncbi:response regulator transcription factor [Brotaphodocola sp.]|uniref:response regulator transcription factor n=1 Tax=Brotaphodocola sp. TaxID=3073577 RepID=UPI003D7DA3EF